jgi:hypothetical protein
VNYCSQALYIHASAITQLITTTTTLYTSPMATRQVAALS